MSTINSFGGTSVLASAQDAGLTIGQAIANGLADAEADMTSVVSNAVEALLKQISTLGSASKDAATNAAALLFGGITGSDRVGLGGIGPRSPIGNIPPWARRAHRPALMDRQGAPILCAPAPAAAHAPAGALTNRQGAPILWAPAPAGAGMVRSPASAC